MPAEVGERRILRLVVTVDRSQLQLARGLRNAAGAVIPLAVGAPTGEIAGGVAVAGGALLVGFAEPGARLAAPGPAGRSWSASPSRAPRLRAGRGRCSWPRRWWAARPSSARSPATSSG